MTFIEVSGSNRAISSSTRSLNNIQSAMIPTFVFLQNILIRLEVFLFVREHISLRGVLSHNPGSTELDIHQRRTGTRRVCMCVCKCAGHACMCIAEGWRVIGAVVALKETPYFPPRSAARPMGDTSSPEVAGLMGSSALQKVVAPTGRRARRRA